MQHNDIFIIVLLMKLMLYCMKKNGIFTFKNTLTLPQNGGNCVPEDLKFKNFTGGMPSDPLLGRRLRQPNFVEPPLLKTWIRTRYKLKCNIVTFKKQSYSGLALA